MKTVLFLFALTLCSATVFSQVPYVYLNSVVFTDSLHGCIVGDQGTILVTSTAGRLWAPPQSAIPAVNLMGVHFVDTANGWAVGWSTVLRTRDGGATWSTLPSPGSGLYAVHFVDTNTGFVTNTGIKDSSLGIFKTTDGGQTWTKKNGVAGGNIPLLSIGFVNANQGWAAGGSSRTFYGALLWTNNGGENWTVIDTSITSNYIYDVHFASSTVGFTAGVLGLLKTTDGGKTWVSKSDNNFRSVFFVDTHTGWAVGLDGVILHTTDDGETWTAQSSSVKDAIYSVYFVNKLQGWAVGGWHSTILATVDGGLHWTKQDPAPTAVAEAGSQAPVSFQLEQNYPNPFNPSTTIAFDLPSRCVVSLKVFDVMGRDVATVVSDELPAGSYQRQWNASGFPSGVYFYRLTAGAYAETKQLVVIK